nr:hypothetical protein [Tanacetum cinerariifolium]
HPDGPQESSSVSSFVTSTLNPISDAGVESIFKTASSPIVSIQTPTPIMTPSTIATITTTSDAPIPPTTIPSIILENLPTFNLAFRFDERLRSLENTFSEYRQTNPFVDAVSAILGIVNQYMTQQMTKAVREAVQIQTDRLQDSLQQENDELLCNIDENMKKIIKGQVKSQVKDQVSRDDFVHPKFSIHDEEDKDEESFDPIVQTPSQVENTDDEDNDEDSHGMNVERDEEDEANELYRDVNINIEGRDIQMTDVQTTQVIKDTHVTLTPVNPEGQQESSSMSSRFVSNMLNPSPDTCIDSIFESTPWVDVSVMTTAELPLLSATTLPPPSIPIISHMQQTPAPSPLNIPTLSLQDLPNFGSLFGFDHRLKTLKTNFSKFMQADQFVEAISSIPENEDFLNKLDENIQKIIKEQVKEQVKISHAVAADLSELELKKILIDKMESNKLIHKSDEKKNLYKALVDAYECDKLIIDSYEDTVTLKRCQDDEDKDEEPFAGSNRGSKRRREGKQPESTSAPKEKTSKTFVKSTEGSKSHHKTASESAPAEEPMHTTQDLEEPAPQEFETGETDNQHVEEASQHPHYNLAKKDDSRTSFNELMDTPVDFSAFVMNRLKVDTLTPELLADPTYELMKRSCKSLVELEFFLEEPLPLIPNSRGRRIIPFDHFINNDLEYLCGGVSSQKYTTLITKTKAADYGHIKWIKDLVPCTMWSQVPESARDVYSKRRIIAVTELQIIEWHNYKHLDWITVRRDDDKFYKFKDGDFKRLRIQDIEDMPLLLNKDRHNRLMHIDELHKFSDDTLNDVRTVVDDRLKGIQMQYLPQTIWRRSDKDRASTMIQAIDKQLKTRRIMWSLEKFVGGRLYEGDFRLLQRTI